MDLGAAVVIRDLVSKWVMLCRKVSCFSIDLLLAIESRILLTSMDEGMRTLVPWMLIALPVSNVYAFILRKYVFSIIINSPEKLTTLDDFSFPKIETFLIVIARSTGAFFIVHCRYKTCM
jgi:hypothetical protein